MTTVTILLVIIVIGLGWIVEILSKIANADPKREAYWDQRLRDDEAYEDQKGRMNILSGKP